MEVKKSRKLTVQTKGSKISIIKLTYFLMILNLIIFIWLVMASVNNNHEIVPDCFQNVNSQLDFLSYWQNTIIGTHSDGQCMNSTFSDDSFDTISETNRLEQCQSNESKQFWRPPNEFFTFTPIHIKPKSRKKVISFSLYGGADRYLNNVIKIIRRYKQYLPDWIPRFWLGSDVPFLMINRLIVEDVEVIIVHQLNNSCPVSFHGMFWRFFISDDEHVERYIVRDSDSMLIEREVDAIDEWIKEKTMFHVMRDHPNHTTEILGGLWGGKVNLTIFSASKQYGQALRKGFSSFNRKGTDQQFLKNYLWPIVKKQMTCHVAYRWKFIDSKGCKNFPTKRNGTLFVGAIMET